MTTSHYLMFQAGVEYGIRKAHMVRARFMATGEVKSALVRLARQANHECIRYKVAARESK